MKASRLLKSLVVAGLFGTALPAYAKQWAILVGIDKYPFRPLQGAVNDAKLLSEALRSHGVDLPDNRVLLNEQATVANFKRTWEEVLKEAKPGDQILLTFAGHGAQEEEFGPPYDEMDKVPGQSYGKDETLVFFDFDPNNPQRGRISDDELYELFEKAKAYSVLFVADSCHSGGITRSALSFSALPKRGGLDTFKPKPPDSERVAPSVSDSQILENVTYVAATENEALEIPEIYAPDQQPHGALSCTFTKALSAADRNGDHIVTQRELENYVKEQVPRLTANRQAPGLVSRGLGREKPAFFTNGASPAPTPSWDARLPIKIEGGTLPLGITGVRVVDPTPIETAAYLCRAAADAGNAAGAICLGDIYNPQNPKMPSGDLEMAFTSYHRAQELSGQEATHKLDDLKKFAQEKAERGNSQAQSLLARWSR